VRPVERLKRDREEEARLSSSRSSSSLSPVSNKERHVIVQFTDDLNPNPLSPSEVLEAMIGRFVSDIARGASLIRQRSTMLSITDNRQSLADRREHLDEAAAACIARLVNLAHDHGLDPLRGLGMIDLELVRLATAPLDRKEGRA
jgi:hypothetical protein